VSSRGLEVGVRLGSRKLYRRRRSDERQNADASPLKVGTTIMQLQGIRKETANGILFTNHAKRYKLPAIVQLLHQYVVQTAELVQLLHSPPV
jgi:hypothetical protein